jgi:hypothetical protein
MIIAQIKQLALALSNLLRPPCIHDAFRAHNTFRQKLLSGGHSSGFLQLHFGLSFSLSLGLALLRTRLLWL